MIIARLQGGLGNQLFQYAAAKSLAQRLGKRFELETITSLQKDRLRRIALDDFNGIFELATKEEVKEFVRFPSLYRHKPALFSRLGRNIYREPHFHFDPHFFQCTDPVFLDGFWQSPLYFGDIEAVIRKDFTIKEELIKNVKDKGGELKGKSSVAVHVRRGDFLHPKAAAYHGVLDAGWYAKAIAQVREKCPGVSIHYFSDDIDWVKQNLPADDVEYVSADTQSAIEDFYLMTRCRHNIIANSSFSWWTAWLNDNPEKMVIAPAKWFMDSRINTGDLIPRNWIRI